jgi:hypothetical protein
MYVRAGSASARKCEMRVQWMINRQGDCRDAGSMREPSTRQVEQQVVPYG